ncbi:uncharacterized protein LOC122363559 isoform X2 [Amphibalanus amphitrite]|uniref:uncharacterized protein LOC122363559 isoform X2 n=1 Tax=Amphibalanus amphitrite TaxID=1232801 RepID=UPI001C912979|nr:uncharacterized protein LOC122363559 isoform X2 [Amphibalanus amphitrite]
MASGGLMSTLMRRKAVEEDHMADTSLARVLGLVDLCCLAVGSTLGLGIYVLAGDVAKTEAGPAVVISFLVAAIASLFAALCYAEFAARVPKAGSAYVYSYVCVGEFVAFVIGWNLILEYVIGTASVARGYSTYVDSIFDQAMQKAFTECCGMDVDFLSAYPDFFALFLVMVLTLLLAIGVRESTRFNNVFTFANLVVVLYVIITGSFKADGANWRINPEEVPNWDYETYGSGGFMPFGISGVMAGAARCFYGFVGFDAVATTGEEAKNPQRSIPLAIIIGLTVIFLSYFGVSAVLTLMWPYYLQDEDAPIPAVFDHLGWESARWIVTIGALFGLSSSLLGALFPLPRILYAMANDGLIFRWMADIHPRFQTPFWSTLLAGVFAAAMASFFDLEQLVDMMSIGTLLAYSLVAVCVLVLRYRDETLGLVDHEADLADGPTLPATASTELLIGSGKNTTLVSRVFNLGRQQNPSHESARLVNHITIAYGVITVGFCAVLVFAAEELSDAEPWAIALAALLGTAMLLCVLIVKLQPESKAHLFFKVPLVPFLPMLSVFANVYLMMKLGPATWIRFAIWMILGLAMYFGYGIRNSSAASGSGKRKREHVQMTNLVPPTIVIEPATPLQRSAASSPHLAAGRSSVGSEPTELIVETAPDDGEERRANETAVGAGEKEKEEEAGDGEGKKEGGEAKEAADSLDQERTLVMFTQTVQRQRGLHAVIEATLRPDGGDPSRSRQLALVQRQIETDRLEQGYEPPPPPRPAAAPVIAEQSEEEKRTAERQAALHAAVARCLGAPAAGAPVPIRVSVEVHSEAPPDSELHETTERVAALLAGGEPDSRRKDQLLAEHWRRHEAAASEATPSPAPPEAAEAPRDPPPSLPEGFTEEVQRTHEAVVEQMAAEPALQQEADPAAALAALHASICDCFNRGWVDLGRGAALADRQKAAEAARGPPPPPVTPAPPPTSRVDPLTAEEKQHLERLHAAISECLSAVRTPPNSPTGGGGSRPPLTPLPIGPGHRPLQRVISNSSFQNIPPQSPQSPLARRVGDKFVIIPVSGDEDSEREDEPTEQPEVQRAIRAVRDEVQTAMARAAAAAGEGESEGEDEEEQKKKEKEREVEQGSSLGANQPAETTVESKPPATEPPAEVRRAMDAVLGEVLAASSPASPASPHSPSAPEEDRFSVSSDEPAEVAVSSGGSSGNVSGDEHSAQPTPEVRRAMNSVLSEMTTAAAARTDDPPPVDGPKPTDDPSTSGDDGPRVGGHDKPNQVAAPPEPNMKEQLDLIIKQAVQKAAKRVSEVPPTGEEEGAGPESPPPLENIGDGMHRIRSRKHKPAATFDMNELMARFEKRNT